jgi:hypothetical protein
VTAARAAQWVCGQAGLSEHESVDEPDTRALIVTCFFLHQARAISAGCL